jgi:hypothetical protein
MEIFPLHRINETHSHNFILQLSDDILSLKENKSNNKSRAEAYLLFSYFIIDRFDLHFSDTFDLSLLISEIEFMRLIYLRELHVDISSPDEITNLIEQREELFSNIDAKRQESIVDTLGPGVKYLKYTPNEKWVNPEYDKVKDNPLHQLITKTLKEWYHIIRGLSKDEFVNDHDYLTWMHYSSKSFSELAYLIYENPLGTNIIPSDDLRFVYSRFGFALSFSLQGIDRWCIEIKKYFSTLKK